MRGVLDRKSDFRGRKALADYTDRFWCHDLVPSHPPGNKGLATTVQAAAAWAQNAPHEPAADQATTVVQEAPAAPSPSMAAASVCGYEVELSCICIRQASRCSLHIRSGTCRNLFRHSVWALSHGYLPCEVLSLAKRPDAFA